MARVRREADASGVRGVMTGNYYVYIELSSGREDHEPNEEIFS
jgi:hypothetical protein